MSCFGHCAKTYGMEFNDTSSSPELPPRVKRFRRFSPAPDIEKTLSRYQIQSAIARAKVLTAAGLVNVEVADRIVSALLDLGRECTAGTGFVREDDTDMYSALMRRLAEKTGTISERMNIGKTDEDWLATDVRLWLRDRILHFLRQLAQVRSYLLQLADIHQEVLIPGYSHMQPRRREMLCFFFLAAESRFREDDRRFVDLFSRVNRLPAGLDGQILQEHPLDRALLAGYLGFDGVIFNTFDSIADHDYLMEFSSCSGILGVHVSQMAGELLLWMTQEFGFVRLPRAFAVDSESFTDHKSTEVLEVLRSRSASLGGRLAEILTQLKGLPFGRSHESHRILEAVNEVCHTLDLVLEMLATILPSLNFDTKRMSDASDQDMSNRANAIDYLIEKGFTSDKAVSLVDPLVEYCRKRKRSMSDLAPGEWSEFSPAFERDIYKYVSSPDNLGQLGPRYEVLSQALHQGRQLLKDDESQLGALCQKVKSLTVEVPSGTE